jgi:hypothetical protein
VNEFTPVSKPIIIRSPTAVIPFCGSSGFPTVNAFDNVALVTAVSAYWTFPSSSPPPAFESQIRSAPTVARYAFTVAGEVTAVKVAPLALMPVTFLTA